MFKTKMYDDVYFKTNLIEKLISEMKDNINMVVSNGLSYEILKTNKCKHHYDTLAFISLDDITHLNTGNSCLNKHCSRCLDVRPKKKIFLDDKYLLDFNKKKIIEIKSGFGSCSLIKTKMFNEINFTNNKENILELEWPSFCRNIREKRGKIVLAPYCQPIIVQKKNNYIECKNEILNTVNEL